MYQTKASLVRALQTMLARAGYQVSLSVIDKAFTVHGKPGNQAGSHALFGLVSHGNVRSMLAALETRGVKLSKSNERVKDLKTTDSFSTDSDPEMVKEFQPFRSNMCPNCEAIDPSRSQATRCPNCGAEVETASQIFASSAV